MAEEEDNGSTSREEQEEALVALIEHRTCEVNNLRKRLAYYKNQLDEAEKRLKDTELKLARLRAVKTEPRSNSPIIDRNERSYKSNKPALVIPVVTPKVSRPPAAAARASCSETVTPPVSSTSVSAGKSDKARREQQNVEVKDKGIKRKFGKTFIITRL
ncbi:hypothetical protein L195_g052376 [Trifolium pratense]|uniref:Uncharacterized protein n=1 Tax=Trifolium pratense TaxID=57577 RepID=A0A2K3K4T0_TRIPR|nr:hypothetical protein L195_g052376 [Trifolium pratense]